ncbi:H-2 class I histocompatibility antigen, Q10 alpha chain-like isoform X2 [Pygocentrus nattereri]|uniref:H-2 class I histocompatibility antigen, Q10 alpha chain-like isoform X2 n=1 Tax=Pygocentrus nattereri TaxID=42514 RepID=UPI001890FC15|nr:H-2 class I histocompatibility antigen, Q10 alpha chain-like isoform X2 [Pygocentrus nattereri]
MHKLIWWLFLLVNVHPASSDSHLVQYFYTGVTHGIHSAKFTAVGLMDGKHFVSYSSHKNILKPEWIKDIVNDECQKTEAQINQDNQAKFTCYVTDVMDVFIQTEGFHIMQWMYGCELHDDGTKRGYMQYGYDGEDFISLDLNTGTWTAANPKAVITKQKWEKNQRKTADYSKAFLLNQCVSFLKKVLNHSRSSLESKVRPEASLFQKDSSSPVVCHATGFFPKAVMISWQKNGEDLHEDVELRETLPNQDGTFQKRSVLTVSPEELNRHNYTCIIQHSSLEKKMVLLVSERRVLSAGGSVGIIIGAVVAVLLLVLIGCVGVFIWKKKQPGFKPVSRYSYARSEGDSSSNNFHCLHADLTEKEEGKKES